MESQINHLRDHIIVCGFGRMGELLVEELASRRVPLIVVENDEARAHDIQDIQQPFLIGDATDEEILVRAGIHRAKSLVAVLSNDAGNVYVTLTARQMNSKLHILARSEQTSTEPKLRHAGATSVISMQAIGAQRMANMLTRPHLVELIEGVARDIDVQVTEFLVDAHSPIADHTLADANLRRLADVLVIAIKRADGSMEFNPSPDSVLHVSDRLLTLGRGDVSKRLADVRLSCELAEKGENI